MKAVAVAVSGGRDSTALLHAAVHAAAALELQVHALHVHHGLAAQADDWRAHVQEQCRRYAADGLPVRFDWRLVDASPAAGDSVEAWARAQRYAALADMARAAGCDLVLLAHHQRDQAETFVLQAMRGGGPAGLAAMPRTALRDGITWARPWLGTPPQAIADYVLRHGLQHVDDASNADPRFARSRLRRSVWPALSAAFPALEAQLHRAAQRAGEAAACLDELAAADAGGAVRDGALLVQPWIALSTARRRNLLRAWLGGPASLIDRLSRELGASQQGCWPAPGGALHLHDGALRFTAAPQPDRIEPPSTLDLSRPGWYAMDGWAGAWQVSAVHSGGVAIRRLLQATVRQRQGGEQFQLAPRSTARALKKQYQARRVPAWERAGPLLFDGDTLLYAPGLGVDARCLAAPGEPQLNLRWMRAAAG